MRYRLEKRKSILFLRDFICHLQFRYLVGRSKSPIVEFCKSILLDDEDDGKNDIFTISLIS